MLAALIFINSGRNYNHKEHKEHKKSLVSFVLFVVLIYRAMRAWVMRSTIVLYSVLLIPLPASSKS